MMYKMKAFIIVLLCVLFTHTATAMMPDEVLPDPVQEQRARDLSHEIRCLVCQGEAIDESQSTFARDMRKLIRNQIAEGQTDAEILSFLQDKYGEYILLSPPATTKTWMLYAMPFIALLFGVMAAIYNMFYKKEMV